VNNPLKERKARFVVTPLGGSVWYYGMVCILHFRLKAGLRTALN
jgi:hypothetical protein